MTACRDEHEISTARGDNFKLDFRDRAVVRTVIYYAKTSTYLSASLSCTVPYRKVIPYRSNVSRYGL